MDLIVYKELEPKKSQKLRYLWLSLAISASVMISVCLISYTPKHRINLSKSMVSKALNDQILNQVSIMILLILNLIIGSLPLFYIMYYHFSNLDHGVIDQYLSSPAEWTRLEVLAFLALRPVITRLDINAIEQENDFKESEIKNMVVSLFGQFISIFLVIFTNCFVIGYFFMERLSLVEYQVDKQVCWKYTVSYFSLNSGTFVVPLVVTAFLPNFIKVPTCKAFRWLLQFFMVILYLPYGRLLYEIIKIMVDTRDHSVWYIMLVITNIVSGYFSIFYVVKHSEYSVAWVRGQFCCWIYLVFISLYRTLSLFDTCSKLS